MTNKMQLLFGILFCTSFLHAQSFRLGLHSGVGFSLSNYYDIQIDQKAFTSAEPNLGVEFDYFPFKSNSLFLSTGVSFIRFANVFQLEGVPYFPQNGGFPKLKQHYYGFKMPVRIGHKTIICERIEVNFSLGGGLLLLASGSFYDYQEGTISRTISDIDFDLAYAFGTRNIGSNLAFIFDSNIGFGYMLSERTTLGLSFSYQLGLNPILGSMFEYRLINKTNPFTLLGDSYVTSKGDALFLNLCFQYKVGGDRNKPNGSK